MPPVHSNPLRNSSPNLSTDKCLYDCFDFTSEKFMNGNTDNEQFECFTDKGKYYSVDSFNNEISSTASCNGFSVIAVNIRSCHANFDELNVILSTLQHKFNIIAVTETWLNEGEEDFFTLDGYVAVGKNKKESLTDHGGVLLYIDESL